MVDPDAFTTFEAAGWEEKAAAYEGAFAPLTSEMIEPLLDAASVGAGTRVLDVATGPGHVAGHASRRGARAVGVDIAQAMVELARELHPGLDFRQADAQALPFEDACFDAVVGNFAILHLGHPERAVAEFVRTIVPGGALALTVWDLPARMRIVGVLVEAVHEVGATPLEDLPAGPDFFRFSADDEFDALLRDGGLQQRRVETIAFTHHMRTADGIWDGLTGATVRMSALVMAQPEGTRQRIREAFDRRLEDYRTADGFELPVSVKLASGRKPAQHGIASTRTGSKRRPAMATTTTTMPTLSDDQLVELLPLIEESDSVELKLTVPELHHRSTARVLGLDPLEGQIRQVVFFDTPKLALEKKGVVVRARRIQGKGDDSVVKLRPVVPHELPESLRSSPDFRVEVDALPGGFVCSGTLKRALPPDAVTKVLTGKRPVRKLFSKEQRAFFAEHAPEAIELDDLAVLGPIYLIKGRVTPKELGRRLVAELWFYPDGSRVLELSTRCATHEAFQVAAEGRAFLTAKGVDLSGEQQTKTRKALGYFARNLADEAG